MLFNRKKNYTHNPVKPKTLVELGEAITFNDLENHISGGGIVTKVVPPGEEMNEYPDIDGVHEVFYEIDTIANNVKGSRGWIRESTMKSRSNREACMPVCLSTSLHPMDYVGIDTCSAVSVSSERADFVFLDESPKAKKSVSLNGVGFGGPEVVGRGPMVVSVLDKDGNQIFMLDPAGVFIKSSEKQAKLRILGQQRMKRFGFMVVQDYTSGEDELDYGDDVHIPLTTKNGILMVRTVPWGLDDVELKMMSDMIQNRQEKELDYFCILGSSVRSSEDIKDIEENCEPGKGTDLNDSTVLIINEAKLSQEERNRVDHWRHAHRSSDGSRYKERCHTCEQSKHKSIYKRNEFFHGTSTSTNIPYWRLYADAYGGQRSMGCESYQGGIGGFVFVCPVSGRIRAKLYSSQDQFPAVLYQVLQEVESEGYVCRELYCDTSSVNISAAAEEVAGMFKLRIIPISGGTPQ